MGKELTLSKLTFRAGTIAGGPPLSINPPTVTVLVGPNGSGKSRVLSEISEWAGGVDQPRLLLEEIEVVWPTHDLARKLLSPYEQTDFPVGSNVPPPGWFRVNAPGVTGVSSGDISDQQLEQALGSGELGHPHFSQIRRSLLLKFFTVRLTGRDRHALSMDQPLGDLRRPYNHVAALFENDLLRRRVSELIFHAFASYLTVDPTSSVGNVRLKLNAREPPSPEIERALSNQAVAYHAGGLFVTEQSDGIQAYTGLVAGVFGLSHKIMLIDEPETFLPPPLARRLGAALASVGQEREATVIAATHSAAFLMGCIESGANTTIVRLTFERSSRDASARQLTNADIRPLMRDPLLRSARALEGLFHRAVVVGESDADRAFYDEINRRLSDVGRGVRDAQFMNAQNWQTTRRIFGPLRKLGVPAACVLDIDTLWGRAGEWQKLYSAAGIDPTSSDAMRLEAQRKAATPSSERAAAKSGGLAAMSSTSKKLLERHLTDLSRIGIFIVPCGELEGWLPTLNVSPAQGKGKWIVAMFNRLGSSPTGKAYVRPASGDVWAFLDQIESWVSDGNRSGMPA